MIKKTIHFTCSDEFPLFVEARNPSLVMSFCRGRGIIDEKFIQRRLLEMFGPGGDFDVEQEPEL